MTVHGAKGLEAPIVFLPDTCSTRSARPPGGLLELDDVERPAGAPAPFVWPVKGTSELEAVQQAKAAVARGETEERNRLLYVALTRARDRLYVAGFEGNNGAAGRLLVQSDQRRPRRYLKEIAEADGRVMWRLASAQTAKPEPSPQGVRQLRLGSALARLGEAPAPREPLIRCRSPPRGSRRSRPTRTASRRAAPSAALPNRRSWRLRRSPTDDRFLRGTLTHALLEHLPALPASAGRPLPKPSLPAVPRSCRPACARYRCRDAGRAARSGVCGAVRPGEPGRGGDRRRDPAPRATGRRCSSPARSIGWSSDGRRC